MFGYRSASPKMRLVTDRLVVRLVNEQDDYRLAEYYAANRDYLKPWDPIRDENHSSWQARLGMINEMYRQGSAYYFVLLDPLETEIRGVANFSNMLHGSFHTCFFGYSLGEMWQGQWLMFEALQAAVRYMQQHMHRIIANYIPHNHRSGILLTRLEFIRKGYAKQYLLIDGQWITDWHYWLGGIAQKCICRCSAPLRAGIQWSPSHPINCGRGRFATVIVFLVLRVQMNSRSGAMPCLSISSTESHFAVVSDLLKRGRHVYVDKPLAASLEQAEALLTWPPGSSADTDGWFQSPLHAAIPASQTGHAARCFAAYMDG